MELRHHLRVVRAWLPLLVAVVVLAGAVAYAVSSLQPKDFEAKATLIVGQSLSGVNPDYSQLLVSQRLSETYASVATTRPILARIIEKLSLTETPEQLAQRVAATAAPDSALLTITGRDGDPARAAALANALAAELIAAWPALQGRQTDVLQSIDEDLDAIRGDIRATQAEIDLLSNAPERTPAQETTLQTLQGRVATLRSTYATLLPFSSINASNLLTVVQPAVPPDAPVAPRPLLNAMLAAMVAFLVVSAIAFVAQHLDDKIKDSDQVQETIGLPTLGTIARIGGGTGRPAMYRLATLLYPRSSAAEGYRTLRTNVEFASVDRPIETLLVTSAIPGEGKTVTAANLAVAFAQGGRRVLLIDADLRRPSTHEIFGLPNTQGLTTLLRSDDARLEAVAQTTEQEHLHILSAGPLPPNPAEVLGSQRMKSVVRSLCAAYDLLIFDSSPLDVFADSAVLSSFLDGTILVVDAARSRRVAVRRAGEALAKANANVLGVVLNNLSTQVHSDYHLYNYSGAEVTTGATAESGRTA